MDRTIRKVTDLAEQQAETYRYWRSRSASERFQATWELSRDTYRDYYRLKGLSWMKKDQRDLLLEFNARNVKFLIVGGYAYSHYTEPRATKDLDVLIATTDENVQLVYRALAEFGAPLADVTARDFQKPKSWFQIGVPPSRVDIVQSIDAIDFDSAWENSVDGIIDDDIPVRFISLDDLIRNKLAVGRLRDLADVEDLRAAVAANAKPAEIEGT